MITDPISINKSQLEKLIDINNCLSSVTTTDKLLSLTTSKAIQYAERDSKGNSYSPTVKQYDRAVNTVQLYYTRKHNYTENWIE